MTHQGACLCGDVTFRIEGAPIVVAHCYCRDCQRASGAGHATAAMFPLSAIDVSGAMAEYQCAAESGGIVTRLFCARCGSRLFGRNTRMKDVMSVSVGALNDPDALQPQVAIFTRSRCSWDALDPGVQSFDAQPAWKPEDGV